VALFLNTSLTPFAKPNGERDSVQRVYACYGIRLTFSCKYVKLSIVFFLHKTYFVRNQLRMVIHRKIYCRLYINFIDIIRKKNEENDFFSINGDTLFND